MLCASLICMIDHVCRLITHMICDCVNVCIVVPCIINA